MVTSRENTELSASLGGTRKPQAHAARLCDNLAMGRKGDGGGDGDGDGSDDDRESGAAASAAIGRNKPHSSLLWLFACSCSVQ